MISVGSKDRSHIGDLHAPGRGGSVANRVVSIQNAIPVGWASAAVLFDRPCTLIRIPHRVLILDESLIPRAGQRVDAEWAGSSFLDAIEVLTIFSSEKNVGSNASSEISSGRVVGYGVRSNSHASGQWP